MFRRRKPEDDMTAQDPNAAPDGAQERADEGQDDLSAPPMKPFSRKGMHMPNKPPAAPFRSDIPRRVVDIPGSTRRPNSLSGQEVDGKKLIVGREICLTGEISACDRLVVEGRVEAALSNARSVEISETGFFKGNAAVEEATIAGHFEGSLAVKGRLSIRSTGRVKGKVSYASLVVEQGGQLSGTVELVEAEAPAAMPPLLGLASGQEG